MDQAMLQGVNEVYTKSHFVFSYLINVFVLHCCAFIANNFKGNTK